ncbi:GGDEF domain-containing protein [Breoghania sp.]|uniref:GGDEF domain-containing protein n=2 Tax=Breoghania sp. TaxID=2065378 RepID=UPI0039F121C2
MSLEYNTLLMALSVSCIAMSMTLAVTWIAYRRDVFLLTWSLSALLLFLGSIVYGLYAAMPSRVPAAVGTTVLSIGFTMCWIAARQFRSRLVPARKYVVLIGVIAVSHWALQLAGLVGLMLLLFNAQAMVLLFATAWEYWCARSERLHSLKWLTALYVLVGLSFALCIIPLAIESPLYLYSAPKNWAETLQTFICIISITAIGGLSLAINQERVVRDRTMEARTDGLTGVLNRRAFDDLSRDSLPRGKTVVAIFDLDFFKDVNDRCGHAFGDLVLRTFASVCSANLRNQDVVARIGGEEFAVVLEDCTVERAIVVANRIRLRFARQKLSFEGERVRCTVSAGVCGSSPDEVVTIHTLLGGADTALYQAKQNGRNCVCQFDMKLAAA